MSCTGCSTKFGLLTKEHSCPNCQFSFCSKCLKSSVKVPKFGKEKKVCNCCFDVLSSRESRDKCETPREPPAALQKRLDALESKTKMSTPASPKSGPDVEEIEHRLRELRRDSKGVIPIHADIEDRLAKLKGVDVSYYRQAPITVYKDNRTSSEKAADLLKETMNLVAMDVRRTNAIHASVDEMQERLSRLRGAASTDSQGEAGTETQQTSTSRAPEDSEAAKVVRQCESQAPQTDCPDEVSRLMSRELKAAVEAARSGIAEIQKDRFLMEQLSTMKTKESGSSKQAEDEEELDDSEAAAEIVARVLEESRLEELEDEQELGLDTGNQEDELPWCVICNEDASLRCHGCSEDLYCRRCYREFHDSEPHRTSEFKKRQQQA